ncbi:PRC-barrel domain-containing protein [Salinifilum ghardaiensis]
MKDVQRAQDLIGVAVFDRAGNRLGRVANVYVDDETLRPEWITVRSGVLGLRETFVPLDGATTAEDRLDVPFTRGDVRNAPRVTAASGHLSDADGRDLFAHYGLLPESAEEA